MGRLAMGEVCDWLVMPFAFKNRSWPATLGGLWSR